MKILVYGINYSPELTGIGKYTGEMCEWLAAKGHKVEVITSMPYYPEWKIHKTYKNKWWHTEVINGVKVSRTPFYVPQKVSAKSRIIHELSFIISSFYFWLPCFFKKYDVVVSICPPLQAGIFPWLYKTVRRKPFVFHFQDLQVDAAKELGLIKNKLLLSFLERTEKFLMHRATRVSTISPGMKARIIQKGIKIEKVFLLPNWVDTDFIKPLSKEESLKDAIGFHANDKIVLYAGNMGEKQGLEMIIHVAEKTQNNPNLFFVFCGEGAAKQKLQDMVLEKALQNVRFFGLQPYEKLNKLLAMADLHLVLQKRAASDLVYPSKFMTILAAGGCSIVTASSKSVFYDLLKGNDLAIEIEPENEKELLSAILENIDKDNKKIKDRARDFAVRELNIHLILNKFESTLLELNRIYN